MIRTRVYRCGMIAAAVWMCSPLAAGALQDSGSAPGQAPVQVRADTREELLRARREQKRVQLHPEQRSGLLRGLAWVEEKGRERIEALNFKRFFPKFGGMSTGSGFAYGTRYWNPRLRGSPVDLQASAAASFNGYQLADFQLGHVNQPQRRLRGVFELRYRDFPQEDFYGLGPDSRQQERTDYRTEDAFVGGNLSFSGDFLSAGLQGGYHQVNISRGTDDDFLDSQDRFDEQSAPGLTRQPNFLELGGHFTLDGRDSPGNAHSGGLLRVQVRRLHDLQLSEFDFTRVRIDGAYYFPLWSSGRTLALHFDTSWDIEDEGSRVPFYFQRTLGGSEMLRGFREFRFRDRNLFALQVEYRWEAMPALEFALFSDAGKVFADRGEFSLDTLKTSWGFGMRVKTRDSVAFRIDVAHSQEGSRIYFKFNPAF